MMSRTHRFARLTLEALEDRCLLSAGTLDPTFNGNGKQTLAFPGGSVTATAVVVQPDGKIVTAGTFQPTGTTNVGTFALARFNADGSLDTGFGTGGRVTLDFGLSGGNEQVSSVAVQADGKILVGGSVAAAGGSHDFAVARLTQAGVLDPSFGTGGEQTIDFGFDDFLTGLAIQPADQKIVVAGYGQQTGAASFEVARLGTDGSLDASFGSGGKVAVTVGAVGKANAVALQADNKIILAGSTGPSGGPNSFAAVRLNADGTLDTSFGTGGKQTAILTPSSSSGNDQATAVAIQNDGRIVLAGDTANPNYTLAAVARLKDDGSLDASFGNGGVATGTTFGAYSLGLQPSYLVTGVAVDDANKILLSSYVEAPSEPTTFTLVRYNPDGSLDTTFNPTNANQFTPTGALLTIPLGSPAQANALVWDRYGRKIVAVGSTTAAGVTSLAVVRLTELSTQVASNAGMFDPSTGTWYFKYNNSAAAVYVPPFGYGAPGWTPLLGDWSGTGAPTEFVHVVDAYESVGVFDPASATWYLKNSNSAGAPDFTPFQYGAPGWIPVVGDWDGNLSTTVGVVDPSTMTWYLKNSNSAGAPDITPFRFGQPGDIPVVGDWDGNGTFTLGVFRPSNATWYLRNSDSAGAPDITPFAYGASYMKPVVGDWDGDGKWTVGVYDPSGNGAWLLRDLNTSGAWDQPPFAYGAQNWTPVVDNYAGAFPPPSLLAAGGEGPGAAAISTGDLNAALTAALGRLQQAGVAPALLSRLSGVTALLQPLASGQLGETLPQQNTIVLSPNAAGHGWFVDPTPYQDEEFTNGTAYAGNSAAGREDLLTAVLHELGHIAGLADDSGSVLMLDALPDGTRRTDALGAAFAGFNS